MQKRTEPGAIFIFLLLVFTLPLPILAADRLEIPFPLLVIYAAWTPSMAAFLALGLVLREPGAIRRLAARWGQWRVGPGWYAAALTTLLVAFLAARLYETISKSVVAPGCFWDGTGVSQRF